MCLNQILYNFLSESSSKDEPKKSESTESKPKEEAMDVDYSNVTDTDFLKSVLEQLPGVESQNKEAEDASKSKDDQSKDKEKKKDGKK